MFARENIGEFGELMADRQSFLPQIYGILISVFYWLVIRQCFFLQII